MYRSPPSDVYVKRTTTTYCTTLRASTVVLKTRPYTHSSVVRLCTVILLQAELRAPTGAFISLCIGTFKSSSWLIQFALCRLGQLPISS